MNQWRPDILVIGPGGIKGYYEIGVIKSLDEHKFLSTVREYVGVSVGSIIGLLLVAGFTIREVIGKFMSTNVLDVFRLDAGRISSAISMFNTKPIRDMLNACMEEKIGFVPTLKQLQLLTNKLFTITTLNVTQQRVEFMNYKNQPVMSVVDAVILSINIPGVFEKIRYRGDLYIDGALGNPYPVNAFDDGETNILGISVPSRLDIENSTINYLTSNIDCPMYHLQKTIMDNASPKVKHIVLEIKTLNMNPSPMEKLDMLKEGFDAGEEFFAEQHKNDETPHVVIKSTFTISDIEINKEEDDLPEKHLPSINELIETVVQNSSDTGRLIDVLHGVLEYVRSGDDEHPMLCELIRSLPLLAKHER